MWKYFWAVIGFLVLFTIIGTIFSWFSDGAATANKEFKPSAMLTKYEWFKNHAADIKAADANIIVLKQNRDRTDSAYKQDWGRDLSKWDPITKNKYLQDMETARQQISAQVATRNNMVTDYNAEASKFNWAPFQTHKDLPPTNFTSLNE